MKLHLPVSLRRVLLAVFTIGCTLASAAHAAILHNSVSLQTYTDFGANMGRYSVYEVNDLLRHLNEGGVPISYTTGQDDYIVTQGMISFESVVSGGFYTAIAPNYAVSVQHNGVPNPVFTDRYLPANTSVRYSGIEYRASENNQFLLTPAADYKATRMSKLITDITPTELYNTPAYITDGAQMKGVLQYRVGGGDMQQADAEGNATWLKDAYNYITGGIAANDLLYSQVAPGKTDNRGMTDDSYTLRLLSTADYGPDGAGTDAYPLPFVTQPGDSGSPVWVWNEDSNSYQLISCHFGRIDRTAFSNGAPTWTFETMESFNKRVDMEAAGHAVHLGAVRETAESTTYSDATNGVSTTTKFGSVTSSAALGFGSVSFCGVQNGVNTWLNLNSLKDTDNWYNYDGSYLNATPKNEDGSRAMTYADLFMTENLVFESAAGQNNSMVLDADVDLGIGSVAFERTDNGGNAVFTVSSAANSLGRDYMLNSAGYNVGAGTEVHLQLANTQRVGGNPYVREWRKVGAGDLYLEGEGNNEIFLNVGGKGTTYLREQGGYAAYNVLINNGATVNLGGQTGQVKRDVTFGNGGGVLDLAGNVQMDWNAAASADGFTIHALTQDAVIANTAAGTTAELRYTASGDTTFLGSFADADGASLRITYDGGNGSSLLLNSIHTKLTGANSGLTVASGNVTLAGTVTEHAIGSATGLNLQRYRNENDWHYADAKMNVEVANNAVFTLGSHARLQGDVSVANGGTFVMQEGVTHRYEYIEGWYREEDTYEIADYYGLHGNVNLANGAEMQVRFSEGTDANTTLTGSIRGEGGMSVDTAQGTLTLAGTNTFSGAKSIERGTVVATGTAALGNTASEKWNIGAQGVLTVENAGAAEAVQHVSAASEGVLALTQNEADALNLNESGHRKLIIGAAEGKVIQYGTAGTDKELAAVDNTWTLGGGGGELVVNVKLNNDGGTLVLGNEYTKGIVTLTNAQNRIGSIRFTGGVTLDYTTPDALGGGHVVLDYTNRLMGRAGTMGIIDNGAKGVLLLDRMGLADVDLKEHTAMALGSEGNAVYNGRVILADGAAYRFGGSTGTLTLTQALTGAHDLVVDGQTYSGGVTNLATAATLTGNVTVMGYDTAQTSNRTGDATLRLSTDNALTTVGTVTLKDGGILDINGTQQQLRHLSMEAGSVLTDSSAGGSGVAELAVAAGETDTLRGTLELNSMVKSGAGTLQLGGTGQYGSLTVQEGTLSLASATALSTVGQTVVQSGAVLQTNNNASDGRIVMAGGTLESGTSTLSGTVYGASGTSVLHNADNQTTKLTGSVAAAEGATLRLTGGTFVISGSTVNEEDNGGTLELAGTRLSFTGANTTVNGTLRADGSAMADKSVSLYSDRDGNNSTRNINHLEIASGTTLKVSERTWNSIWNIHELTGSGTLQWDSGTTHYYSARMVLDGDNAFSGDLNFNRTRTATSDRVYEAYAVLAHDGAAKNATVNLSGANESNIMSLAINTENAQMKGLTGNAYSAIYAGDAVTGDGNNQHSFEIFKQLPVSTREATITITGTGGTYSGNIYRGENGNGISLVMNGSGIQTIDGSVVDLQDVTVNSGTLRLTTDTVDVAGSITLARAATLYVGKNSVYSLTEGETLKIKSGATFGMARLAGTLKLGGGILSFDSNTLDKDVAALQSFYVASDTDSLTVDFTNTSGLKTGVDYKLATTMATSSKWSGLSGMTYTASGIGDYMNAAFSTTSGDLKVRFTMAEGANLWHGTNSNHEWTSDHFAAGTVTAVFNDSALNRDVVLASDRSMDSAIIDTDKGYTFTSEGGTATIGTLTMRSEGTAVLNENAVRVTGDTHLNAGTLVVRDGETLQGTTSGEGTLRMEVAGGSASMDKVGTLANLQLAGGATYTVSNGSAMNITDTLRVEKGATAVFNTLDSQAAHLVSDGTVQATTLAYTTGKTAEFNGTTALGSATVDHADAVVSFNGATTIRDSSAEYDLIINRGTVNINGELTVKGHVQLGNNSTGAAKSFINIGKDGVLKTALLNSSWGFNTMTVDGLIDTEYFNLWTGTTQEIKGGGTINATKLTGGNAGTYHFTGVRLNIGEGGIDGNREILLRDATLGALDNWTANRGFKLDGMVTVDTEKVDRETLEHTGEGAALAISGVLSGDAATLVKDGKGTLKLSGNNSYAAGTLIKEGALIAAHASALGTGAVEVQAKGTLQLGAASVSAADVTLAEGRVDVAAGTAAAAMTLDSLTIRNEGSIGAGVQLKAQNGAGIVSLAAAGAGDACITGSLLLTKDEDDNSFTMAGKNGTALNNALLHLAEGTTLHLTDVVLGATSRITDDAATVSVGNVVFEAAAGVNMKLTEAAEPVTLAAAAAPEKPNASLLLTNVEDVTLTGYHLTIALNDISMDTLNNYGTVGISLGEGASFSEQLDVTVTCDGATADTFYVGDDFSTAYFRTSDFKTPEPATATLGLLALAALAARRRRKDV